MNGKSSANISALGNGYETWRMINGRIILPSEAAVQRKRSKIVAASSIKGKRKG